MTPLSLDILPLAYWDRGVSEQGQIDHFYTVEPTKIDLAAPIAEAHQTCAKTFRAMHGMFWRRSDELPHSELRDPKSYYGSTV